MFTYQVKINKSIRTFDKTYMSIRPSSSILFQRQEEHITDVVELVEDDLDFGGAVASVGFVEVVGSVTFSSLTLRLQAFFLPLHS